MLSELNIDDSSKTVTGLRAAAARGRDTKIRELLERGADINGKDEGGMTALLWAAARGRSPTVQLLVENGADVNLRNDEGTSVMEFWQRSGGEDLDDVEKLLLEHAFYEDEPPEYSSTRGGSGDRVTAEDHGELDEIKELLEERMSQERMRNGADWEKSRPKV
jgi:hypothetical protein